MFSMPYVDLYFAYYVETGTFLDVPVIDPGQFRKNIMKKDAYVHLFRTVFETQK